MASKCPDLSCCLHEVAGTLSQPDPERTVTASSAIYVCCSCRRTERMTWTEVAGSLEHEWEPKCGRPYLVDPKFHAGIFGPSPMAAAVPEMKRLREAEDAHQRKWHPGMGGRT